MSQQNIEILRRCLKAFNRGDDEAWIANWHPDAELYDIPEIPDAPDVYRGHDGIRRWLANVRGLVWQDITFEPKGFTSRGEEVIVEVTARGVGKGSGVPTEWSFYLVAQMREGKVARARGFFRKEQALEAARPRDHESLPQAGRDDESLPQAGRADRHRETWGRRLVTPHVSVSPKRSILTRPGRRKSD